MTAHPSVPLDAVLSDAVGTVSIKAITYDVLGLNAIEYQMLDLINAGTLTSAAPIWECIARIVPSMPADVRATLTMPAAGSILAVAQGLIRQVGDALPNSSGPTTEIPTPAGESPAS